MEGEVYKEVCRIENLLSAWTKVKEKGSAGGIDRVTIDSFEADLEKNIKQLSERLSSYHYIPEPYQEIKIPKDNNEFRSLSLPTKNERFAKILYPERVTLTNKRKISLAKKDIFVYNENGFCIKIMLFENL